MDKGEQVCWFMTQQPSEFGMENRAITQPIIEESLTGDLSRSNMPRPGLSKETFVLLRELIYKKCGIFFQDSKAYLLEKKISARFEDVEVRTFEEYHSLLSDGLKGDREFVRLVDVMTNKETSFFRDPRQLDTFKGNVLSKIIEASAQSLNKDLRVWSAGCSTGEEPYTLAMMIKDDGLFAGGWKVDIIGSDISSFALDTAGKGLYGWYAVRNVPHHYLNKYFSNNDKVYELIPAVKKMVTFKKINLFNDSEIRAIDKRDVIFCRNVLIYFSEDSKKKVITNLAQTLKKGGYLVVGFSETISHLTDLVQPVNMGGCMVYQKV